MSGFFYENVVHEFDSVVQYLQGAMTFNIYRSIDDFDIRVDTRDFEVSWIVTCLILSLKSL